MSPPICPPYSNCPIGVIDHSLKVSRLPTREEVLLTECPPRIEFVFQDSYNSSQERLQWALRTMQEFRTGELLGNRILADNLPPEVRARAQASPECRSNLASDACRALLMSLNHFYNHSE